MKLVNGIKDFEFNFEMKPISEDEFDVGKELEDLSKKEENRIPIDEQNLMKSFQVIEERTRPKVDDHVFKRVIPRVRKLNIH